MHCQHIEIDLPEFPYDPFVIVLLPSRRGELYRLASPGNALAEIENTWEGWKANGQEFTRGNACEDAVRHGVRQAIESGKTSLTEVASPERAPLPRNVTRLHGDDCRCISCDPDDWRDDLETQRAISRYLRTQH